MTPVKYTLTETAKTPSRATPDASGYDLVADMKANLAPGDRAVIGTGLSVAIPKGYEAQVRPRSGLAVKYGVTVLNAPGSIDSDYTGEIKVILINHGRQYFCITPGMRIAQLVFAKVEYPVLARVDKIDGTQRGSGGFGSTGVF
jgi:dUTP pyrophosphatase